MAKIRWGSILIGLALMASPALASAQSINVSQLGALLAELQQLQTQFAQAKGQSPASSSTCTDLTFTGGVGMTGTEVSLLQAFLGITPTTGYFGLKTKAALLAWQSAHGISATGYFGPLTRSAMACASGSTGANSSSSGQMQTYTNAQYGFSFQYPSDFSPTPVTESSGTKVTLIGPQLSGALLTPSVFVEASADPHTISTCNAQNVSSLATQTLAPLSALGLNITPVMGTQTFDGVSFRSASVSADLEGIFAQVSFSAALHNGLCYIVGTWVDGRDPSTQEQLQSNSPVVLPVAAASIAAEESTVLQSLTFSAPAAAE